MQRGNLLKVGNRATAFVSLLMVALVLMAGCAPRATSGALAATADESQIVVDLPALVLDVQDSGAISVGGQPLTELGGGSFSASLAGIAIPPEVVQSVIAYKIQHIQIDNTQEGLLILVNGQSIPTLAWDGEKLVATAEVLETLGGGVALLERVLPLLTNVGIGVIMRFPIASGDAALPLVAEPSEAAAASIAAQREFLDAVGTPPTFALTINYADDGTWALADVAQAEWSALLPIPWEMLNLTPATVQSVSAAGINELGLATNSDGIFISINGKTLPYLSWADGRVTHLLTLAKDTGLLNQVLGDSPDIATILDYVEAILPAVQASNVSLRITFP